MISNPCPFCGGSNNRDKIEIGDTVLLDGDTPGVVKMIFDGCIYKQVWGINLDLTKWDEQFPGWTDELVYCVKLLLPQKIKQYGNLDGKNVMHATSVPARVVTKTESDKWIDDLEKKI